MSHRIWQVNFCRCLQITQNTQEGGKKNWTHRWQSNLNDFFFSIWHYLFGTSQWSRDHKLANLFYQFDRYGQLSILFIHFVLFIPFINVWHVLT